MNGTKSLRKKSENKKFSNCLPEEQVIQFDNFFKSAKFFYTNMGMQPYNLAKTNYPSLRTFISYLVFYVSFININYVMFSEMLFATNTLRHGGDLMKAIFTYSCAGFTTMGIVKMFFMWLKKSSVNRFVHSLREVYPSTSKAQHVYRVEEYFQRCLRITLAFSTLYMLGVWTYNLLPAVLHVYQGKIQHNELSKPALAYFMYVPWQWQGHWSYYMLYFSQALAGHTAGSSHIASDLVMGGLAIQLVMHYNYLARAASRYKVKGRRRKLEHRKMDLQFLAKNIQHHGRLLELSAQLNDIFGMSLFFNLATSTFVLCFVAFQITLSADPLDLFKMSLFLMVLMAQVLLICHFSQQLMDASTNIADALYEHNWYNADVSYRRMLVLCMARAQKPAQLKATIFVPVSRTTITVFIQIPYKFFTLMRTMYPEK